MARCVVIVDSETGKLIDVAGNARETGRYRKFSRRMLSSDTNPRLDYGVNGGDSLEVSQGGYAGKEIKLLADKVSVSGELEVDGVSINQIAEEQIEPVLDRISAGDGVAVTSDDEAEGGARLVISLSQDVLDTLSAVSGAMGNIDLSGFVSKTAIANAVSEINFGPSLDLAQTKAMLNQLLANLTSLAGSGTAPAGQEET